MAAHSLTRSQSLEPDIRLEDYLDDKLQSTADFENLESLLANVEIQRSQLQAQLDDATKELQDARQSAHDRQGGLFRSIQEFEELQKSIDVRLQAMTTSATPDEAIHRLEQPMKQLQKLDLAHQYVSLLQDVEEMRLQARSHLPQDPKAALQPYSRLKKLCTHLHELQGPADQAAAHLVSYVTGITDRLWSEMKEIMSREMDTILKQRNWPFGVDPGTEMDSEWLRCFEKLVELQVPEVLYSEGVVPLLPFEVMARPFVLWFRYHFMSDTATSNPQSFNTFCIPQFLSLIDKWAEFFRENVGYVLANSFGDTKVGDVSVYIDPACALVAALLPVTREKIEACVNYGLKNPQYFSSLMKQLMDFDDELRSRYDFDGGDPIRGWAGLTSEVLDKHFDYWLTAEKEFALERYRSIMNSDDARSIDYEYTNQGKMKPTFAAVRVTDLLRSVTSQYDRIRRFSHKLRFLIDIQVEILDEYHSRLRDSLEAYSTFTSTLGRTLHGLTKEQAAALEGTGTLETLCKVLGSADHIVMTLKDWGNEEFFVTLWDQLQTRAARSDDESNLAGGLSHDHVKDRISTSVGVDGDGGILFDETIAAFSNRREAARQYLVAALIDSHQKAFRGYVSKSEWISMDGDPNVDPSETDMSPELSGPVTILQRNLTFLTPTLSTAVYRRVWREALESLQSLVWKEVLMSHSFSGSGATQFACDIEYLASTVERYISDGSTSLESLRDAARLLSLGLEPVEDGVSSLYQASDRFFKDNTEAKVALEKLGIDSLTPANARDIVRKRVENKD